MESIDQLYTQLKSIQVRLESFSDSTLCSSGALVFVTPPTADSPKISANPAVINDLTLLDPVSIENEEIIRSEEWLALARSYIHSHPRRWTTSKLRLLEKTVIASLDKAAAQVRCLKEEQWEALWVAAINRHRYKDNLIDTST